MVEIPPLKPDEQGELAVPFIAPSTPGRYERYRIYHCSLRAVAIKLWLTPSAKQCRNPCSGLPTVYPDLSTRYDWPV